ncbi:MAG: hypothetical protein AAF236_12685 [Verrucomicrobiota bacterium]
MRLNASRSGKERGVALLLVVMATTILAVTVGGLWMSSQTSWQSGELEQARFEAGLIADSGIELALHPEIEPGDFALFQEIDPSRRFEAVITTEEGRIPINDLTEEGWRETTATLFEIWGLDSATALRVSESIGDWIDEDDNTLPNGAENAFYAGEGFSTYPTNAPFTSLEQVLLVSGMEEVARIQPLWRDYFSIFSSGSIDVNAASWEVLEAVTGATRDSAQSFVAIRNGDDLLQGTTDDYRFEDLGEVQGNLAIADSEWNTFSSQLVITGSLRRIESTGRVGDFVVRRVALAVSTIEDGETQWAVVSKWSE